MGCQILEEGVVGHASHDGAVDWGVRGEDFLCPDEEGIAIRDQAFDGLGAFAIHIDVDATFAF